MLNGGGGAIKDSRQKMATRWCGYEGITEPSTIPEIFIIERMKQEKLRKKCDNKNQKAGKNTVVARKVPTPRDTGSFQKLEKEKKYTFHRTLARMLGFTPVRPTSHLWPPEL